MGRPAARVGDMHVCPMFDGPKPHVGGPVLPPGRPNVLIGGLPAATVGNMCTCASAPDVILMGSLGVFIGGMPAARMGDPTVHGGRIVMGLPTVLIGDIGMAAIELGMMPQLPNPCDMLKEAMSKDMSDSDFREMIDFARIAVSQLPENSRNRVYQQLNQAEEFNHVRNMGRLANHVYDGKGGLPPGVTEVSQEELARMGINRDMMVDESSGFKSNIYRDENGKYIISYAGTEDISKDGGADAAQGVGMETEQYNRAMRLSKTMRNNVGPEGFETTGHSLGGGLASSGSAMTGAKGTTFNAAGLHHRTTERQGLTQRDSELNSSRVDAYYNTKDPLNAVQDNRKKVLFGAGLGASALIGSAGSFFAGMLAGDGALPPAYGNRHPISPPPDKDSYIDGHQMGNMEEAMKIEQQRQLINLMANLGCN